MKEDRVTLSRKILRVLDEAIEWENDILESELRAECYSMNAPAYTKGRLDEVREKIAIILEKWI
jgi:hypothetical protein